MDCPSPLRINSNIWGQYNNKLGKSLQPTEKKKQKQCFLLVNTDEMPVFLLAHLYPSRLQTIDCLHLKLCPLTNLF